MIEIIPKQEVKHPAWNNVAIGIGVILLLVSIVGTLGLRQINSNTKKTIEEFDLQLSQEMTEDESQLEGRVFLYRDKLNDFKKISENREYPLAFFDFIEKQVHENIFFKSLALDPVNNEVFLKGEAKNFQDLAEQVLILKTQDSVDNIALSSIEFGDSGEVIFGIDIIFTKDFFTTLIEI